MSNFYDEMAELIIRLRKEKILQWKLMQCIKVEAAVLAEVRMQNEVEIDVETKIITWPMGVTSKPPESKPTNGKGKAKGARTSANTARGKNCVFGLLVNKVQAEQCGSVQQLEQKRQPAPGPSTSCASGGVEDG